VTTTTVPPSAGAFTEFCGCDILTDPICSPHVGLLRFEMKVKYFSMMNRFTFAGVLAVVDRPEILILSHLEEDFVRIRVRRHPFSMLGNKFHLDSFD
jgi:hypothetical protein